MGTLIRVREEEANNFTPSRQISSDKNDKFCDSVEYAVSNRNNNIDDDDDDQEDVADCVP